MIGRVILLILALFIALNLWSHYKRQTPEKQKDLVWRYAVFGLVGVIIALAATGRLHWLAGVIAALIPIARNLGGLALRAMPFLSFLRQRGFANSILAGKFVKLELNPMNGELNGEILAGEHQGAKLSQLSQQQLQELLQSFQQTGGEYADMHSARLLAAYMYRRFQGGFDYNFGNTQGSGQQNSAGGSGNMDRKEALQILGLDDQCSKEDIVLAHRKLMAKVHPDKGGNDYLAAKINEAKEFLLKA